MCGLVFDAPNCAEILYYSSNWHNTSETSLCLNLRSCQSQASSFGLSFAFSPILLSLQIIMYTTQDCPKCLDLIALNQTACYWSWCNFSKAVPTIRNYMTSSSPIVISVSRYKKVWVRAYIAHLLFFIVWFVFAKNSELERKRGLWIASKTPVFLLFEHTHDSLQ